MLSRVQGFVVFLASCFCPLKTVHNTIMWGYIISLYRTLELLVDIHVPLPSGQAVVTELEIESSVGQVCLSGV